MPRRSLLSAERESLLALPDTKDKLSRHYTFSETDLSIIRQLRGSANRLGFAVQLCYPRFPGIILGIDELPFLTLSWLLSSSRSASKVGTSMGCGSRLGASTWSNWAQTPIKGDRLKSSPDYKQWRRQARSFQSEVQAISTQFGAPNYIKNIQANKVNNYLNIGKKQLYKAKDFSKAVSGIEMTALYKKSMEFSKYLGRAAWVATIFGVRDNFIDIAKTCAQDEAFSEACVRAGVKNSASIAINVLVGEGIGFVGARLVPVSGGLSIIPMAGGLYAWGLYGGDVSNSGGDGFEYLVFDFYDDAVEFVSSTVDSLSSKL